MSGIKDTVTLSNGVKLPQIGLGVFQVEKEDDLRRSVQAALQAGYIHIDTAAAYNNEEMVGRAVRDFGKREALFITSKLWNEQQGEVEKAYEESLHRLNMDHLDLYLIHWPSPWRKQYVEAWKGMVRLYEKGLVKAIGVSNFTPELIDELYAATGVMPMVNQVERHPLFQQGELQRYCKEKNIVTEAYAPLTSGHLGDITPVLQPLADKHGKSVAQIILRWQLQTEWVIIPKSITPKRVKENADLFDFELDQADLAAIAKIDRGERFFPSPTTADF